GSGVVGLLPGPDGCTNGLAIGREPGHFHSGALWPVSSETVAADKILQQVFGPGIAIRFPPRTRTSQETRPASELGCRRAPGGSLVQSVALLGRVPVTG